MNKGICRIWEFSSCILLPTIDVYLRIGCNWRSHFNCCISVGFFHVYRTELYIQLHIIFIGETAVYYLNSLSNSRYLVTLLMIWNLNKRTALLLPDMKSLHFGEYLKSGLSSFLRFLFSFIVSSELLTCYISGPVTSTFLG